MKFLLSGNTAGILAVLYASLSGLPAPFAPVHLLFINLLTDSLPAIAIGVEPSHGELMKDKPRDVSKPIMDGRFAMEVLLQGIVIAAVTMVAYHMGTEASGHGTGMTMAFATLSLARLVHGFNCRTDAPLTLKTFFMNKASFMAFFAGILLLSAVLLLEPLHKLFEVAELTGNQLGCIGILALIPLLVVQISKRLIKR
ncbi:Calcium-transporting ATPase 1 [bioreactor metagenome]|uniref:Calcium-transporting ATPase 1 n=1 Tax=bioreactor metagenome TaxID=1076179 RepID=A0A645HIT9_9ZZZZ